LGLLLIPAGFPGAWVQLAALALFGWSTGFELVGIPPLLILLVAVVTAELTDGLVGGPGDERDRVARRRTGAVGLAFGIGGAALGLAYPLLGSLLGGLTGAFVGCSLGALWGRTHTRGYGFFAARVIATTMKIGAGVAVAIVALLSLRQ
jgi:hypothetical protein